MSGNKKFSLLVGLDHEPAALLFNSTGCQPGQQDAFDAVEFAADERVGRVAVRSTDVFLYRVFEQIRVVESGSADDAYLKNIIIVIDVESCFFRTLPKKGLTLTLYFIFYGRLGDARNRTESDDGRIKRTTVGPTKGYDATAVEVQTIGRFQQVVSFKIRNSRRHTERSFMLANRYSFFFGIFDKARRLGHDNCSFRRRFFFFFALVGDRCLKNEK